MSTTATINPGDRIRLVVLEVTIDGKAHRTVRRYSWTGGDPEHICVPETCEVCTGGAVRTVLRRLNPGTGKTTAAAQVAQITVLRDGQSVAR